MICLFQLSSTAAAAAFHRRHLMVWKIFAPRFLFEGSSLILTLLSLLVGYSYYCRVDNCVKRWMLSLKEYLNLIEDKCWSTCIFKLTFETLTWVILSMCPIACMAKWPLLHGLFPFHIHFCLRGLYLRFTIWIRSFYIVHFEFRIDHPKHINVFIFEYLIMFFSILPSFTLPQSATYIVWYDFLSYISLGCVFPSRKIYIFLVLTQSFLLTVFILPWVIDIMVLHISIHTKSLTKSNLASHNFFT